MTTSPEPASPEASRSYRQQEVRLLCSTCREVATRGCPGCGRPLCTSHAPPRWRGCPQCEAAYIAAQVKWAPGGALGFTVILVGVLVVLVATGAACWELSRMEAFRLVSLAPTATALALQPVFWVLAVLLPRLVFFRKRRRKGGSDDRVNR